MSKKRLRKMTEKYEAERDRRYRELREADQRALQIKEQADRDALELDRQIRSYKDEKANQLREQLGAERNQYMSRTEYTSAHIALQNEMKSGYDRLDAMIKPISEYVASQQGSTTGKDSQQKLVVMLVGLFVSLLTIGGILVAVAYAVRPH